MQKFEYNEWDQNVAPIHFRDPRFAEANADYFKQYIDFRVHGINPYSAFRRVFGEAYMDQYAPMRIEYLEANPYFREEFDKALEEANIVDVWNIKVSVNELLQIVRDRMAKESTRLNAIKELNVLIGITYVDENGKTKVGDSLADLYAEERALMRKMPPPVPKAKPEASDDE